MAFSDHTIEEARRKAGYVCCVCHEASTSLTIQIHHIISQESGGSDDSDNAIALCPTHHDLLQGNKEKITRLRAVRDWWYERVEAMFGPHEQALMKEISKELIAQSLPSLKNSLKEFMDLQIQQITAESAPLFVS